LEQPIELKDLCPQSTVKDIKTELAKVINVPFFVYYNGVSLKVATTLQEAHIVDGSSVNIVKKHTTSAISQCKLRMSKGQKTSRVHMALNNIQNDTQEIKQDTTALRNYFSTELPDDCSRSEAIRRVQRERDVANWKLRELKQSSDDKAPQAICDAAVENIPEKKGRKRKAAAGVAVDPAVAAARDEAEQLRQEISASKTDVDDKKKAYHAAAEGTEECQTALDVFLQAQNDLKDKQKALTAKNKSIKDLKAASSGSAPSTSPLKRPAAARKPSSRNQRLAGGSVPAGCGTGGSSSSAAPEAASEDAQDVD